MEYELRERLATMFSEVMQDVRENKWPAFSTAARDEGLEPYVALGRMLVRLMERELDNGDKRKRFEA